MPEIRTLAAVDFADGLRVLVEDAADPTGFRKFPIRIEDYDAGSGTGTWSPDFTANGPFQWRRITGNSTLGNPTAVAGASGLLYIEIDTSTPPTLAFGTDWKMPGGTIEIDAANDRVNVFAWRKRGANDVTLTFLGAY